MYFCIVVVLFDFRAILIVDCVCITLLWLTDAIAHTRKKQKIDRNVSAFIGLMKELIRALGKIFKKKTINDPNRLRKCHSCKICRNFQFIDAWFEKYFRYNKS